MYSEVSLPFNSPIVFGAGTHMIISACLGPHWKLAAVTEAMPSASGRASVSWQAEVPEAGAAAPPSCCLDVERMESLSGSGLTTMWRVWAA